MSEWQTTIFLVVGYAVSVIFSYGVVRADVCAHYDKLDYVEYPSIRDRDWTAMHYPRLLAIGIPACLIPIGNVVFALIVSGFMRAGWSLTRKPRILSEVA